MYFLLPPATLFSPLQCHCHGPVVLVPHANSRCILIISRKSVTTLCVWISYRGWNIGSIFKMKYSNVMMLTQWRASLSGEEAASKKLSVYSRVQYGSIHAVVRLRARKTSLPYIYMHLFRQTAMLKAGGVQMSAGVQKTLSDPKVMWLLVTIGMHLGHALAQLVEALHYSGMVACSIPDYVVENLIDMIFPATLRSWGWLTSNRNEYQEYFLRGKGGRCVRVTTVAPSCADCLEIW